jgi:hypothetical protein
MPPGGGLQLVEQTNLCKKDDAAGLIGRKYSPRMLCKKE